MSERFVRESFIADDISTEALRIEDQVAGLKVNVQHYLGLQTPDGEAAVTEFGQMTRSTIA